MIIDVSVHNGTIDWDAVKAAGIEGAILRCGYGQDKPAQDDKQFNRNVLECSRLGIPFGTYLYSYADSVRSAESEAFHALRLCESLGLSMPIFFDAEESKLAGVSLENFKAFASIVKAAGQRVGLYTGEYFYNANMRGAGQITDVLWIAKYGVNNGQPGKQPILKDGAEVDLWQYTSRGQCAGIKSSGLDCSLILAKGDLFGDAPAAAKSDEQIAKEVLAGAWGNGAERKERLTAAGYHYAVIQELVNKLLAAKTNEELAKEVLAGKWGNGRTRFNKLRAAGYDPEAVQAIVNTLV